MSNNEKKSTHEIGKELEEWIVKRLKVTGLDRKARVQKQSGAGLNKGDIWNKLNICFEAKNRKSFKIKWFEQAKKDSLGYQEPVVVWHHSEKTPGDNVKVVLNWDYFEKLLLSAQQPETKEPDRELRWEIEQLKRAAQAVIKKLKQLEISDRDFQWKVERLVSQAKSIIKILK